MAHHLHTKSLPSLRAFTMKTPCQIKTLIQAYISQQVSHHVVRAITYTKSLFLEVFDTKDDTKNHTIKLKNRKKKKQKKIFYSIRMCFTRSSSHVIPMMEPHAYYDSTWDSMINVTKEGDDDMKDYLQWLEEEKDNTNGGDIVDGASEIDRLAEKFIEMCHEKFRLEKQESYRRYQEMLARSL